MHISVQSSKIGIQNYFIITSNVPIKTKLTELMRVEGNLKEKYFWLKLHWHIIMDGQPVMILYQIIKVRPVYKGN